MDEKTIKKMRALGREFAQDCLVGRSDGYIERRAYRMARHLVARSVTDRTEDELDTLAAYACDGIFEALAEDE